MVTRTVTVFCNTRLTDQNQVGVQKGRSLFLKIFQGRLFSSLFLDFLAASWDGQSFSGKDQVWVRCWSRDWSESTFGDVQVEEVQVENGLNAAGDDDDLVKIRLVVVSVEPVAEVKESENWIKS